MAKTSRNLVIRLTDWMIALFGASFLMWFAITQPVLLSKPSDTMTIVSPDNLKKHVQLLTVGYAPRTISFGNLNETANYIYRQFQYIGSPSYQKINTISEQYQNVVLQLGPDTEEIIVLGAHYDAENESIDTEGNASGIATLIELGRQLAKESYRLEVGIVLVAYPLSLNQSYDRRITGSYIHAKSLKEANKKVRLMVSLDSVGHFNSEEGSQKHPYQFLDILYPNKGNYVNLVGRVQDFQAIRTIKKGFTNSLALPIYSQSLPENFISAKSSDHISYWREGYPAVLLSDTKNYREPTNKGLAPKDRLDYRKMALLVDGLYQAMLKTATSIESWQLAQRARNNLSRREVN